MNIKDKRISTTIKLSQQAFGKYKLQIIALTILGFLSGLLEGIGVNALIPLFSFFLKGGEQGNDIITKFLRDFFSYININFNLKQILIFICCLFILKAIVLLIFNYISIKITTNYEERTRNNLFKKTLKAHWPYLLKQKLGHLENTIKIDAERSAGMLQQISGIIMIFTCLIMYTLVAINISFFITIITLVLGGVLFLIFKPLIYKTRVISHEVVRINRQVAHHVNESITGIKTVKVMLADDKIIRKGKELFSKLKVAKVKIFLFRTFSGSMLQPISLIFICVVFAFSYNTPNFQFSALIAVVYLIQRIFQYIKQFQMKLHLINANIPFLQSVLNYESQSSINKEKHYGSSPFQFNQALEFRKVNFSYNTEKVILSSLNFSIVKGEMVGLIGPSGVGKTTIVDLLLRLFLPKNGKILLDGKDVQEIDIEEWRGSIGYVSQDIFLMNDTIANNIKFYNNSITDREMERAAKMANIYKFIQECPDKFSTLIGERGILLSAGQRQRIIIARVLARKPKILILDEATSALDNESEIKIQKVIESLKGKITVLVIAHRLSTVINSDKLLVLEKGKIIEQGIPSELLKNKESYFYKVYNIRK